jgi:hypothetical protein
VRRRLTGNIVGRRSFLSVASACVCAALIGGENRLVQGELSLLNVPPVNSMPFGLPSNPISRIARSKPFALYQIERSPAPVSLSADL